METIMEILGAQSRGLDWLLWWHAAEVGDVARIVRNAMRDAHEGVCEFAY